MSASTGVKTKLFNNTQTSLHNPNFAKGKIPQPILRRFGLEATVRPSLAFYNTCGEADKLFTTLLKLKQK